MHNSVWTLVLCALPALSAQTIVQHPDPDLVADPPHPVSHNVMDVAWGTAARDATGLSVTMMVRPRIPQRNTIHASWIDLHLVNVVWAEPVQFGHSGAQRTRVHFTDFSTMVVEQCLVDRYPAGCQLGDFWMSWIEALSENPPPGAVVWDGAVKVLSYASGCRAAVVVGGLQADTLQDGLVPGQPTWTRINMQSGPQLQTCLTMEEAIDFSNGVYYAVTP